MKVLVTGANGFVGSHVVRQLLASGVEVGALVRPGAPMGRLADYRDRFELLQADLADSASVSAKLTEFRPEHCIHLAWYAVPGRYLDAVENLDSLKDSLALIEALGRSGCRHLVGVGTCAEYDIGSGVLREDLPTMPATLYAAAKLALNLIAGQRLAQLGVGFAWARLFYLYGPYEDERRLVPAVINNLLSDQVFLSTPGEQVRDYLHVEDVASALCSISERELAGAFNVCAGEPTTIATILQTVGELVGRPGLVRLGALPYREWEPMSVLGDNGRLKEQAGWAPRYELRDGLASTLAWWRRYRGIPAAEHPAETSSKGTPRRGG